jgi:cyanophycinase
MLLFSMIRPTVVILAILLFVSADAAQFPIYSSTLVLAGGEIDDNNTAVYGPMVRAAGGHNAIIAVITAASFDGCCDPDSSWVLYNSIFSTYSPASVFWVPIDINHTHNNANTTILRQLESATLIFFSGGDQTRVVTSFFNDDHVVSPALDLIRSKFFGTRPGFAVAGSSAGTACQPSTVMIANGLSYSALVNGSIPNQSDGEDNLL